METYAIVLGYAIPFFFGLIAIEALAAKWKAVEVYHDMDTISSLSSGMTNTLKSILGLTVVIVSYSFLHKHLAIFDIQSNLFLYILAFIGIDFASYWSHRFNHAINLFWNRHIVHHSSEEFNLACALRQPIGDIIGIYFFLYIPLALIGVPGEVIAVIAPLHLFAQFWYHTKLIKNLGFLENILVTPSHHRVHHAINDIYLDKNLAAIFIVWDKIFGTFQEELTSEPPVYGVKKAVSTYNPVLINFQHLWQLTKDAWRAQSWWDKLRIWYMPTGWRPVDVNEKYPITITNDPTKQIKYRPQLSMNLKIWTWIQFIIFNGFVLLLLFQIANYSYLELINFSLFIFVGIFAYTSLMDKNILAVVFEFIKCGLGLFFLYNSTNWFFIESYIPAGNMVVGIYLIVSLILTLYFYFNLEKEQASEPAFSK